MPTFYRYGALWSSTTQCHTLPRYALCTAAGQLHKSLFQCNVMHWSGAQFPTSEGWIWIPAGCIGHALHGVCGIISSVGSLAWLAIQSFPILSNHSPSFVQAVSKQGVRSSFLHVSHIPSPSHAPFCPSIVQAVTKPPCCLPPRRHKQSCWYMVWYFWGM